MEEVFTLWKEKRISDDSLKAVLTTLFSGFNELEILSRIIHFGSPSEIDQCIHLFFPAKSASERKEVFLQLFVFSPASTWVSQRLRHGESVKAIVEALWPQFENANTFHLLLVLLAAEVPLEESLLVLKGFVSAEDLSKFRDDLLSLYDFKSVPALLRQLHQEDLNALQCYQKVKESLPLLPDFNLLFHLKTSYSIQELYQVIDEFQISLTEAEIRELGLIPANVNTLEGLVDFVSSHTVPIELIGKRIKAFHGENFSQSWITTLLDMRFNLEEIITEASRCFEGISKEKIVEEVRKSVDFVDIRQILQEAFAQSMAVGPALDRIWSYYEILSYPEAFDLFLAVGYDAIAIKEGLLMRYPNHQ